MLNLTNLTLINMDLLEKFINSLHEKINKRSELVLYISDVLSIERESANRRLNRNVQFTIPEMEKLSRQLGISLDSLMLDKKGNLLPNLNMKMPMSDHFEDLIEMIDSQAGKFEKICIEPVELGAAFSSVPLEFFAAYPGLEKLMYYKWGYFHVGSKDFDNYSLWEMPERLRKINRRLIKVNDKIKRHIYIWNPLTILSLVKEIKYFKKIHAINNEDIDLLKEEIHNMLDKIENYAKMGGYGHGDRVEMYVSVVNHGLNFCFFKTDNNFHVTYDGYFISLDYCNKSTSFNGIQEWITSMKKVSTLISESGAVERRLFFEEQHNYISQI